MVQPCEEYGFLDQRHSQARDSDQSIGLGPIAKAIFGSDYKPKKGSTLVEGKWRSVLLMYKWGWPNEELAKEQEVLIIIIIHCEL